MEDFEKEKQLKKYKTMATGLFIAMAVIYLVITFILKRWPQNWMGYLQAFSEAGMVGALADWFAVTALFNRPLGLPIPHTNLIENSKQRIGNNLGDFVVQNFLNPTTIKPYIKKIEPAAMLAEWLQKPKNKELLVAEACKIINSLLLKTNEAEVSKLLGAKARGLIKDLPMNDFAANSLHYVLQHNEHQQLITLLAEKIKTYILNNNDVIKDKVKDESYFFIPKFVDNNLASKITKGLYNYFEEIEKQPSHRLRREITDQLYIFEEDLRVNPEKKEQLKNIADKLFTEETLEKYAAALWKGLKEKLIIQLQDVNSSFRKYLDKQLTKFAQSLHTDVAMQKRMNSWLQLTAYKYILKNSNNAGTLISQTVGNWKGRDLSRKLELEVGKDLQFIRVNGTLVGGLVGLIIHFITEKLF